MKHLFQITVSFALLFIIGIYSPSISEGAEGVQALAVLDEDGNRVLLYEGSYALVIGVSRYNNGLQPLPGVLSDVKAVKSALEHNGFHVDTVIDPDKNGLTDAFELFIKRYGGNAENRLLFYYAGHGYTIKPKFGGDSLGYITTIDTPNPNKDRSEFKRVALSLQRIEEYALNIDAKHALFIFDSCFSGSLFSIGRSIPENISYKTGKPVRQFITAGNEEETVPDKSIFRQQFVAALKGEGDANHDGYLTGAELGEFLQSTVINYSKGSQHPQYGKIRNPNLDKGDYVFAVSNASASPKRGVCNMT